MKQKKQLTTKQQFHRQAFRNILGLLLALAIVALSIYLPSRFLQLQQQNMMGQFEKSMLDTVSLDPLTSEPASSIDPNLINVESFSQDDYDKFIAYLSSLSSDLSVNYSQFPAYYDDIFSKMSDLGYSSIESLISSGILPQFDFSQYYVSRIEPIVSSRSSKIIENPDPSPKAEESAGVVMVDEFPPFYRLYYFENTGSYSAVVTFDSTYGRVTQLHITGLASDFDENMRDHLLQYAGYLQILDYLDTPEVTKNGNIRTASAYTKDRKALVSASVERLFNSSEWGIPVYQCSFSIQAIEK